jgi:simple sugar transport system ATP-binding protein
MGKEYIQLRGIKKTFPNGVCALRGADLTVCEGEIHALVGENAAGKSTLMNILYGVLKADAGEILMNGEPVHIADSSDAIRLGIGMVHQHFMLVPSFTVLENIVLGSEDKYKNKFGKIDFERARKDIREIMKQIDVDLDLDSVTGSVTIGLQSKIEIIKALFRGAKLLILDEPTTVLAPTEVDSFFEFLRKLRDNGTTMIYISHRMREIFDLTDRITILRKGETISDVKTDEATMEQISRDMLGYEVTAFERDEKRIDRAESNCRFRVEGLCMSGRRINLEDISFEIYGGEVLGIAGIEGNGQVELADALIGLKKIRSGKILLDGTDVAGESISKRRARKMAYIPEDRMHKGLAQNCTITDNTITGHLKEAFLGKKKITVNWPGADSYATEIAKEYKVEGFRSSDQLISGLSGGNMQKVIIGRELYDRPAMTILSQPTAGIDFNAQSIIHGKINELKREGCSFLLISEDLDELVRMSDRICVLCRGKLVKEFSDPEAFDLNEIGYYMTGVKKDENDG